MTASSASFLFQIQDLTARFVPSLSDRVSERFCVSALLFRFPGQMEEQGLQAVVFPCKRNHKDSGIHQFLQQIRLFLPASRKPGRNLVFIHRKAADLRILPQ